MEKFFLALSFLTRCPAPSRSNRLLESDDFAKSFTFFPVVGALIGLAIATVLVGCRYLFPSAISGFLAVAFLLWITRALHLDGFSDWIDGLGGGYTPKRRREIMKDSRIGVFGAAAVSVLIGLKAFSFASLQESEAWFAIIIAPVLGRFSMVLLAWRAIPADENKGLGARFIEGFSRKILVISTLWLSPFFILNVRFTSIALSVAVISVFLLRRHFISSFQTISGDLFGATCEVVETLTLLIAVIFTRFLR